MPPDSNEYDTLHAGFHWQVPERFNIADVCCARWAADPTRTAIVFDLGDGVVHRSSYREIDRAANRLANALAALGVRRGDRVAIVLPQRPERVAGHRARVDIPRVRRDGGHDRLIDAGHFRQHVFDIADNLVTLIDERGTSYSYTYDILNRRLTETDGRGQITYAYEYADMQPTEITDRLGHVTRIGYDVLGNVTSLVRPLTTESFEYDGLSYLTHHTDGRGNPTEYTYDIGSRLTRVTLPGGYVAPIWDFQYDALDRLVTQIDPLDRETTFQ